MNAYQRRELEGDMLERYEEQGLEPPEPGTKEWHRAVKNTSANMAAYDYRPPKREEQ